MQLSGNELVIDRKETLQELHRLKGPPFGDHAVRLLEAVPDLATSIDAEHVREHIVEESFRPDASRLIDHNGLGDEIELPQRTGGFFFLHEVTLKQERCIVHQLKPNLPVCFQDRIVDENPLSGFQRDIHFSEVRHARSD